MSPFNSSLPTRLILVMAVGVLLPACQKSDVGPAETTGRQIDQSMKKAGEKVDDATVKMGERLEEAGEKLKQSTQKEN
jgi:hypothetical protein